MNYKIIVSFLVFCLCRETFSFLNGFPKEQCDEMDPTKIEIDESAIKAMESDLNNTDGYNEEPLPTSVQLSGSLSLHRLSVPEGTKYRRGGTLDITIRGPEFNAFMLQMRKFGTDERRGVEQPVRVGEFVSWPPSIQPVKCDKDQNTALTNKNYLPKSGITIKWKAPKDDVGDILLVARFVVRDEYYPITESREIPISSFPVNLKNCGKAKSCILFSEKSASCHEDNCDYILTYNVLNSTSVEFVLGGTGKGGHSYLAVGFSTTPEAEKMKIFACTRTKTSSEIKFFSLQSMEEGLVEHNVHLDNKDMDIFDDRLWCKFVASMTTPVEEGHVLDLSLPMYQVYMRGTTNNTKSANIPILPSKLLVSKKEIQVEKIKLQYHTMEKPKAGSGSEALTVFPLLFLLVILLHFELFKTTL